MLHHRGGGGGGGGGGRGGREREPEYQVRGETCDNHKCHACRALDIKRSCSVFYFALLIKVKQSFLVSQKKPLYKKNENKK